VTQVCLTLKKGEIMKRHTVKRAAKVQQFRVEVKADNSGTWAGNGLKFDTVGEAVTYAIDLMSRWMLVTDWHVVDQDDNEEITRDQYMNGAIVTIHPKEVSA
jgi:hypothetical protein